ncbi:MAG: hypothetical protein C0453_08260 [Comamonadaceae bacterium]|nr:hypothetical protein [Comamonadaceae bacterium]
MSWGSARPHRLPAQPSCWVRYPNAAIEASYEALLLELDAHFAVWPWVLGNRPSVADFGLFGPLYAHQYRDPASGAIMRALAPHLVAWVERLRDARATGPVEAAAGEQMPDSLLPVLLRQMREQMPELADTAERFTAWLQAHPGEPVPRTLGLHDFTIDGCSAPRIVRPYALWMLQRAREAYLSLDGNDLLRADALLDATGGALFRDFPDPVPLRRDGMSVAPAPRWNAASAREEPQRRQHDLGEQHQQQQHTQLRQQVR